MNIFPISTQEKQKLYESIYLNNTDLKNNIPCICGYYGRACRNMDNKANSMLCNGCTLSLFISTVEAILEVCNEKENIGIEHYSRKIKEKNNSSKIFLYRKFIKVFDR